MANHKVSINLPKRELGRADATFEIDKDGEKLGELRISNGSAVWFPKNGPKGYKLGWTALNALFLEHGKKCEKR
jgi:hypothetical protein